MSSAVLQRSARVFKVPAMLTFILRPLFAILLALALLTPAMAQTSLLTSSSDTENSDGLKALIDEAKRDGSTVIVVRPGAEAEPEPMMAVFDAERLLAARERLVAIFAAAPGLPGSMADVWRGTMMEAAPWWFGRGVLNALVGLFIAWLVMRPLQAKLRVSFSSMFESDPVTTADKARYLLFRALMAVAYAVLSVIIAGLIAVVLHNGDVRTRIVTVEIILFYGLYRLLRYGVSWNLLAHDVPHHRLANLSDGEALRMHRHWWMMVVAVGVAGLVIRLFVLLGFRTPDGAFNGNGALNLAEAQLLFIIMSALVTGGVALIALLNWKAVAKSMTPRSPSAQFYKARAALAQAAPLFVVVYSVSALLVMVYRIVTLKPGAGALIAGPFLVTYVALVVMGLALIIIQWLYGRRERRFAERQAAERERRAEEEARIHALMMAEREDDDDEDGEEMVVNTPAAATTDPVEFEYQPLLRQPIEKAVGVTVLVFAIGELGRIWGLDLSAEGHPFASALDIALVIALGWLGYRALCVFVDRRLLEEGGGPAAEEEEMGNEGGAGASRMATLLPIFRYVVTAIIITVAITIMLAELGVDIGPLFAGAGVVGIAVGFGAQKLIQDVFSGAFFLLDDAFRRGEYVEVDAVRGTVEKISVRSFQLRHHLGALHTLPFGEIRQLTNYSRDWVMMKLPLRVTYDTDVEKVRKLVKKLGQSLLEHPQVGHTFLEPLKSQGVWKMEDSAMIIRVKFMTKPGEQFVTRKVVYESIQDLFAREGIHFAHKEVTVRLAGGQDVEALSDDEKQAVSAAARSVIDAEEEAAAAAGGKAEGGR